MNEKNNTWSEHIIVVDCTFMDALLKDFSSHFSQRLGRTLDKADLCHWLDCLLLDAGIQGSGQQFVAFIHHKATKEMAQMQPGKFAELDGQAFRDHLGEFAMGCFPVESMTTASEFMNESLRAALESPDVKHVLVVGDMLAYGEDLRKSLAERKKTLEQMKESMKEVTLFTMHPTPPSPLYKEVILGYSVMSALGIRSDEL